MTNEVEIVKYKIYMGWKTEGKVVCLKFWLQDSQLRAFLPKDDK